MPPAPRDDLAPIWAADPRPAATRRRPGPFLRFLRVLVILALLIAMPLVATLLAYREATGDSYTPDLRFPSSGGSRIGVSFTFLPRPVACLPTTRPKGDGMTDRIEGHGGELALAALRAAGVGEMFTLSGGHVFPLYDAAHKSGFPIYDVRHEQSAVFAAEAVAKLQRRPGLAVLTAGPGVTNGISGLTSAFFNASPVLVLGGRAPAVPLGRGQPAGDRPRAAGRPGHQARRDGVRHRRDPGARSRAALTAALTPHRGPVFLDLPLEVVFSTGEADAPAAPDVPVVEPDPDEVARAAALIAGAERPVIIAGSDVYAGDAVAALREAAEALQVPVFTNGMGRGALPPGHPLAFAKARRAALDGADVVVVVGTPLDFRLGFGDFGAAQVVHIVDAPRQRAAHVDAGRLARRRPAADPVRARRLRPATGPTTSEWIADLRAAEDAAQGPRRRGDGRRHRPDQAGPGLRRAAQGARRGRGDHRRRRRLRLVRRQATWSRPSPAPGWTRARTAASAPAWATRWAPGSPTPTARSAC